MLIPRGGELLKPSLDISKLTDQNWRPVLWLEASLFLGFHISLLHLCYCLYRTGRKVHYCLCNKCFLLLFGGRNILFRPGFLHIPHSCSSIQTLPVLQAIGMWSASHPIQTRQEPLKGAHSPCAPAYPVGSIVPMEPWQPLGSMPLSSSLCTVLQKPCSKPPDRGRGW